MKITQIVEKLERIRKEKGDIQVMFDDPNSHYGPFAANTLSVCVAMEDEYPDDFDMPEGFTFVEINN